HYPLNSLLLSGYTTAERQKPEITHTEMDQDMRPSFHLISQFPGLIPFSQQKGLRVQKRVHFSPNQTNQIYINMIEAIFDSESGTTNS
ncbi:TPA: hypothetical protein ACRTO2_004397, partial [Escherichia coli]